MNTYFVLKSKHGEQFWGGLVSGQIFTVGHADCAQRFFNEMDAQSACALANHFGLFGGTVVEAVQS